MEDIKELKYDSRNCNLGTDEGMELLDKSVGELGLGRSVLVDKNNNVIAGNKTLETAVKRGIKKIVVVETSGDRLVAVKRTDLELDSKKGREMALGDNAISAVNLKWDKEQIDKLSQEFNLEQGRWGEPLPPVEIHEVEDNSEGDDSNSQDEGQLVICPNCYEEFKIGKDGKRIG